jgi:hypothetical protein
LFCELKEGSGDVVNEEKAMEIQYSTVNLRRAAGDVGAEEKVVEIIIVRRLAVKF